MAGYKTTVKNDNPVSFHTFDLDTQALHAGQIIDETHQNRNPMFMNGINYELEYISLNPIQTSDQSSILFARNEKDEFGYFSPIWMNIPHSSEYNLPQWSIEFFLKKVPTGSIRDQYDLAWYRDANTPLIKKGNAINIYLADPWAGTDRIGVKLFENTDDEIKIEHITSTDYNIYDTENHYVITYGVTQVDVNEYGSAVSLYQNGRLMARHTFTSFDAPPNMVNASQWLIMGNAGSDPVTDFCSEYTALDQLAIYNYVLSDEQISNHYRKTKTYKNLIKYDKPTYFWRMNDTTTMNMKMLAEVGTDGDYYGNILKDQPSTENIIDSQSVYFSNGGTATVNNRTAYGYAPMININDDYSVEFWFNSAQSQRSVLFDCHEEYPNYRGVSIYLNSKNGVVDKGIIQVNESNSYILHTDDGENYSDGEWHHFVFRRYGLNLDLIIDGKHLATMEAHLLGANGWASQMHLMSIDPGELNATGNLSEVAIYNKALQDIQINSHYHFSTRHKIFGYTLLEGEGVPSTVRFYDHITGNKVGELISLTDGEYTFYTYSNKKLDIVALLSDNVTTRYRIHAPIIPSEYDDPHL